MSNKTMKNAIALGSGALVAGVVAIATPSPSWAMPVLSNTAAVRTAASNQLTEVHYRGHGYYGHGYYGHRYYGGGYYHHGYGYPYGGYSYPYAYQYYPYYYPYSYYYPFSFGWGWGGW
ncbi:MAG: hypothetical protein ACREC0_14995 [Methylocella sp.]